MWMRDFLTAGKPDLESPVELGALGLVAMSSHTSVTLSTQFSATISTWRNTLASYTTCSTSSHANVFPWMLTTPHIAPCSTVFNPTKKSEKLRKIKKCEKSWSEEIKQIEIIPTNNKSLLLGPFTTFITKYPKVRILN